MYKRQPVRTYKLNLPSFPHIFKIPIVLITNITVRALCSDIPAAFAKSLDVNSLFSTAGIKFSASQGFRSSIISATVNGILSARLTFFLDPFISDMYLYSVISSKTARKCNRGLQSKSLIPVSYTHLLILIGSERVIIGNYLIYPSFVCMIYRIFPYGYINRCNIACLV